MWHSTQYLRFIEGRKERRKAGRQAQYIRFIERAREREKGKEERKRKKEKWVPVYTNLMYSRSCHLFARFSLALSVFITAGRKGKKKRQAGWPVAGSVGGYKVLVSAGGKKPIWWRKERFRGLLVF